MENKDIKLDASQLHMLSTKTIILKNPEPDIKERLDYITACINAKWELIAEKYKYGR